MKRLAWLWQEPRFAALGAWLSRLVEAGTHGYPLETKRRLMILNMIAYLIVVTTLIYALQQTFLDHDRYWPIIYINFAIVVIVATVPLMHRFGPVAAALLILVTEYVALFAFTYYLGRESGLHIQYVAFSAGAFVVLGLGRLWMIIPAIAIALGLHILCWFWFPQSEAAIPAPQDVLDSLYAQAAITTFGIIAAAVYYAFRLAENAKAETEALLRNILPDKVVERLKVRPAEPVADTFPEASILFADISGFVPLARRLGAADTVALLNTLVSTFDDLAERHGVEKIKTIGDAYMVASGVPEPVPDYAARLAHMALAMQDAVRRLCTETGYDLTMRMGLATGPVMAGVIGRQKFTYDIWGDAVNLAARLESASTPGRIHICPVSSEKLAEHFELEPRGPMEIKGVGERSTWFLIAANAAEELPSPLVGEARREGHRNAGRRNSSHP
ncbi:adenylate/guanylate cyclase domain-containing protein [Hyphomicrobium sp. CS1GBMeth3]|uniref:adenylate/guanylate cyclase domain-containing protein n=1 Tax=Hyphomicrobium sp. CS1GBMeth3 TaxID=1892845 RepID=UPI001FCCC16A|nr:adenylate/guanylate cyclase domain-containing protein [Hyphomicrobium sp. CS1GBMeth3]